ncbi:RING finger protein 207 [Fopius arisanus]|uniref:RING finger protein 207 n=1 Tax=Fopius arisanus TaxID=64838 RepID=A0A0C9RII2_9HYME|nr:PREDICTED: RING finger protein 207-like [Fopius arisanus]
MMASSGTGAGDGVDGDGSSGLRNPLICGVCQDYYTEPCLLSCFHTFCARCLRNTQIDGKITCPICGQMTQLKEGSQLPPADQLMRQLIEIANSENPACANCDKRDKTTMFFCTTCGQALCTHCREHTHRAKMFSTHEVIHMSKCSKDTQRRCASHGELYIMYSQSTKSMLCATCVRDTPADARMHCVDIDTAWQQASKKMEKAANSICEIQAGVRDGVLALKSQLDELKHSLETEKRSLNAYCQVMQETIGKSHSSIISELQRQFESKDRMVRAQLINLGSALPVLQMHLMLCTVFTSGATKYQFLELAHPMLERLGRVAQLGHPSRPSLISAHLKMNYKAEFARSLQSFLVQSQGQGHKDSLYEHTHSNQNDQPHLQTSKTPPRTQKPGPDRGPFSSHCRNFDSQLKDLSQQLITVKERLEELHRDVAMLRRANTPPLGSRYEHVTRDCRLLEQQLEHHQVELERLRNIFDALWEEQLCKIHIEKEIFHSQMNDILTLRGEVKQLQSLTQQLEPFVKSFSAGITAGEVSSAAADAAGHQHLQALLDHVTRMQMQESGQGPAPTKDCRHGKTGADNILYMKESKEVPARSHTPSGGVGALLDSGGNIIVYGTAKSSEAKRGVLSQLIEKARMREDRKKSPGREEGRDRSQTRRSRKSPDQAKPKTPPGQASSSKVRSLYRTLKDTCGDIIDHGDKMESHQQHVHSAGAADESEYQRISEASTLGEAKKSRVQAQIHAVPQEETKVQSQQSKSQPLPTSSSSSIQKSAKVYPASDSEDVFYGDKSSEARRRRRASCDSLSTTGSGNSRRSSIAEGTIGGPISQDTRKTLLVLIGPTPKSKSASSLVQKQRSWETFPRPKSKRSPAVAAAEARATGLGPLKKADSFEGHEEAVRTLVAAVQETRVQRHHAHHHRHHRKCKTN